MPLITLLCLCYAQYVSGTIMPIITSSRRQRCLPHRPSGSRFAASWKLSAGRMEECLDRWLYSHRSGHSSILPALNFQPAAIREPDGLCGNQSYRRELVMMGIMVSETY